MVKSIIYSPRTSLLETIKLKGKITMGAQIKVGFKIPKFVSIILPDKFQNIEMSATLNLGSMTILDCDLHYDTESEKLDAKFDNVGKNGKTEIEQILVIQNLIFQ
ncbi:MAG: hypothetical protein IKR52_06775 [Paludibacteraceae bacterium]|nr:hypothetical protein [Paludibacteraceae bacterium]